MRDFSSWNLSLGRWGGISVRLHVLLLLLALFVIHAVTLPVDSWPAWYAGTLLSVLVVSVLLHELGHAAMAVRLGGRVEEIMLWPFGGLSPPDLPHDARTELAVTLAGPMVNAMICAASLPALVMTDVADWQLLNPLAPPVPEEMTRFAWRGCLSLVFWINWVILLVNLLPAAPLDAGRLLRAGLWSAFGLRAAVHIGSRIAQVAAVGLWVAAWAVHNTEYAFAWIPLVLLGAVLFFSAQHELQRLREHVSDESFGYDFSHGFSDADSDEVATSRTDAGPMRRWLEERREARLARQRQIEAEEEMRMDDILARLHERGLQGLSEEDRAILNRVSARYRNRLRQSH